MNIRRANAWLIEMLVGAVLFGPINVFAGALADSPLSLKGAVPPNVMFALSVEYPTANTAAYQDSDAYSSGSTYLGYFDPDKCYTYDSANGWFAPAGWATSHTCSLQWSGNLLNWATMTGLDEFRYAMTGGNRSTDTATLTVLERAYQTGQGGTGNFTDKTFSGNGSTPWPNGTALTFQNQGRGVGMLVSVAGADVANCTDPSSTWNGCSLTIQRTGSTGSCSSWTGTGTSSSPYRCAVFGSWSGGETYASVTPATSSPVSTSTATTVTCSNPSYSGSFNCTLTDSFSAAGSCTTWAGNGSSASPFTCSTFGSFGASAFAASSSAAATSFTTPVTTVQTYNDVISSSSCTVSGGTSITCTLPSKTPDTATCTIKSGIGSNSSPYRCTSSSTWSFSGSEAYVGSTIASSPNKTSINTKSYYLPTNISYSTSTTSNQTLYYIPSYSGSDTAGYYYYSSYSLAISGSDSYNVRVKVCDTTIGQESNCKQIGSSWKPTGSIQDNGQNMRFGVTSYFNASDIDNAVLRSKLKYVAPLKYSSSGGSATNPNMEWSATDGTFVQNPDASDSATANSAIGSVSNTGVINYINKFGGTSHSYKSYDDLGKLYYETLKYLRGLQPTADFYNGATAANSDGFPVISTWDDPILYSCQKNYIITMGDSHTWCDKRLPGGTYASTGNGQCNSYVDSNGHSHAQDTSSLSGDSGVNVTTQTNSVGSLEGLGSIATTLTGAGSSASYYMAGLSKWAASSDIRPDDSAKQQTIGKQTVKTFVIDVNENKDCGYQSQFWLAAKYGNPASYDSSGNWLTTSNPWSGTTTLPASACNSRSPAGYSASGGSVTWPKNLLRAGDPASMIASVQSAIASIQAQIGDESALAQSSGSLNTGTGAYIYRAIYNSGGWTGDVQALMIDTSGTISSTPAWSASAKLPAAASRTVLTFNDGLQANGSAETTTNSRRGVTFDSANFTTNLSSRQQAALNHDEFGTVDDLGPDRVDYLRGVQSNEAPNGYAWRPRTSLLGDFIDSTPVYVAAPQAGLPGASYRTYALSIKNRKPMIYVGGNDGMLHAFDASFTIDATTHNPVVTSTSGTELFAYVPSAVYANLSLLMSPNYSHKFYVDGTPAVSEACFGDKCASNAEASSDWKTVLVGGLNAGGQGVYALDVTDPTSFSAANVIWEFTDQDDADLGFTFGKPLIRRMNDGRWAVIFGNGYNNTVADSHSSTTGRAYLYILYVDGPGAGHTWTQGTDYFKIELKSPSEPASPTLPLNPPNGLSGITGMDTDLNGTVDRLYAGDRNGNVWVIDVTSSNPTQWKAAFGTATSPLPLFSAKDSASPANAQQITTGIQVVRGPNGGFMAMFGTGSWVDVTDPLSPFKTDTFYGIWDMNDNSTRVSGRGSLQEQEILAYVDANGDACSIATATAGSCFAIFSNCKPNYSSGAALQSNQSALCPSGIAYAAGGAQQMGWYFDLPGSGERIYSAQPQVSGGVVTFTTLQPASDPCSGNTAGMEYSLSWKSGGAPTSPVYALPSSTTGFISFAYGGTTQQVAGAGVRTSGGASQTGTQAIANPSPGSVSCAPPAGTPAPPSASCSGTACNSTGNTLYVPGWGFLMNLQGGTARSGSGKCLLDCKNTQSGGGLPTCTWKYVQDAVGRLSWRQIIR